MGRQTTSVIQTLGDVVGRARAVVARSAWARGALLLLGVVVFAVLAWRAFTSLPDTGGWRWGFAALLSSVTTPFTILLNASEFRLIARTADSSFGWREALTTTVVASLANLLPVPGAAAVRTTALMRRGASLRVAAEANLLAALIWAGLSAVVGAVAVLAGTDVRPLIPVVIAFAGAAAVPVFALRVRNFAGSSVAGGLVAVEFVTVLISAVRIYIAARVLNQALGFGESVVVSLGQVLAALIGFVPGGLGLRELVAAGLASVIGSDVDVAIAATVVDRAAAQVGMLAVVFVLFVVLGGSTGRLLQDVRRPAGPSEEELG